MSNFRMCLEFITITFCTYLAASLAISLIGDFGYRDVLCFPAQFFGLCILYWIPAFARLQDVAKLK